MLRNNFYKQTAATADTTSIKLVSQHPIFEGHFPEQPITPGACLLQITEELWADKIHMPVEFAVVDALKFLHVVLPGQELCFHFQEKDERTVRIIVADQQIKYAQFTVTYLCLDPDL